MTKKKIIKEEDFVDGIIESVGKESDKVWEKSVQEKSSPHMSVDQIADRADKAQQDYLKKVAAGKGLKGGGIALRGVGRAVMKKGGKV